jgi:hypothetical protein
MTRRCDHCADDLHLPVVVYGRVFCARACAVMFARQHPAIVRAYEAAYPLTQVIA